MPVILCVAGRSDHPFAETINAALAVLAAPLAKTRNEVRRSNRRKAAAVSLTGLFLAVESARKLWDVEIGPAGIAFGFDRCHGSRGWLLEAGDRAWVCVFVDPAGRNLVERRGVEIVEFLTALFLAGDELRGFEQDEMLGHRLTCHSEISAKLS